MFPRPVAVSSSPRAVRLVGPIRLWMPLAALSILVGALAGAWAGRPASAGQDQGSPPGPAPLAVPIINFTGSEPQLDHVCRASIAVQNVGERAAAALLVEWGKEGAAGCKAPSSIQCSGMIAPGGRWTFHGAQLGLPSRSAMIFSVGGARLSDLGLDLGFDDTVVGHLCAALNMAAVGDCDTYARFRAAYDNGAVFAGVPLAFARGPRLVAMVGRTCPGRETPGVEVSASYVAVTCEASVARPRAYWAHPVLGAGQSRTSAVYLQNTSDAAASVRLAFLALDADCGAQPRACGELLLDPGFTEPVPMAGCVPEGARGAIRVESDRPLAVVVQEDGPDTLSTAELSPLPAEDASGPAPGFGAALFAALVPEPDRGFAAEVSIFNPSPDRLARVAVEFLDRDGRLADRAELEVCQGGLKAYRREPTGARPGRAVGSVRVISLDGLPVEGSLQLEAESQRGVVLAAASQRLQALDAARPGLVQALPQLSRDLDQTGEQAELALAAHGAAGGAVEVAVLRYDANALVATHCRRIAAGTVDYMDLGEQPGVAVGFIGSAIVSAVWWTTVDPDGDAIAPLLGAALVTRTGTRDGEDVPGDELSVSPGIPLAWLPAGFAGSGAWRCMPPPSLAPPAPTAEVPPRARPEALDAMAWLPVLGNQGHDAGVCATTVRVANRGAAPAKALLVALPEPGLCGGDCDGPSHVACSGLLAPGGTWTFEPGTVTPDSFSAVVYSLSTRTMAEAGLGQGDARLVADVLCERLPEALRGPDDGAGGCDRERLFRVAFLTGRTFGDVPAGAAAGPAIQATVERTCPGDVTPGTVATAAYAGIPGRRADLPPAAGGAAEHVDSGGLVYADKVGMNSVLYLQNLGLECASVTVSARALGDCLGERLSRLYTLAPGQAFPFDLSDVVGPDWFGTVTLRSEQPLAALIEHVYRDTLRTLPTYHGALPFDFDGDGRMDGADVALAQAAVGRTPADPAWDARMDLTMDGRIDGQDVELINLARCAWPTPAPGPGAPLAAPPRAQTWLPLIGGDGPGGSPDCAPSVAVLNLGDVPAKVIAILWAAGSGGTSGEAEGPSWVECSPLLPPGGSWDVTGRDLRRVEGGLLLGVRADVMADGGGSPDLAADLLCEGLFFGVVEDADDLARFLAAWNAEQPWAGIPLAGLAMPLAARVERDCQAQGPGPTSPRRDLDAYAGLGSNLLPAWDPAAGGYVVQVPRVYQDIAGLTTRLWLQNAGPEVAEVDLWYQAQGACNDRVRCATLTIQPGETAFYDAGACGLVDFQGTAWLRSTRPLAAYAETFGRHVRFGAAALPPRVSRDDLGAPRAGAEGVALFGPLAYEAAHGWDVGVNVTNASMTGDAWVDVMFLDAAGATVSSLDGRICPGNTETFFVPTTEALPGRPGPSGSVRVISRPSTDRPWEAPAAVVANVIQMRHSDPARVVTLEALAYPLLPADLVGDWPARRAQPRGVGGTAVIAVPGLARQAGGNAEDPRSEVVVSNHADLPGRTDVTVHFFDASGKVGEARASLPAGATATIRLPDVGLPASFRGGAIVSATYWDHGLSAGGPALGPAVALSAAGVTRRGADQARDGLPGPRTAAVMGVPLAGMPKGVGIDPPRSRIFLPMLRRAQ